jgi:hypothetical protein
MALALGSRLGPYEILTGHLMSVQVTASRTFAHGSSRVLFRTGIAAPSSCLDDHTMTANVQRFLFRLPAATNAPPELKTILDWRALLGKQKETRPAGAAPS